MARGMSLEDEYVYSVVFDNDNVNAFRPKFTYAYGPYMSLGAARRTLKLQEGTWNQSNGRILRSAVTWEAMENAGLKGPRNNR